MSEQAKLLPCPFCGPGNSMVDPWYDDVSKRWAVGCGRCGSSSGRSVHAEGSKEAAIKSWNMRGLTPEVATLDAWIEREFTGHGVAVRREDDPPIPGEPLMSMAEAKELTRRAVAKFAVPPAGAARHEETVK